MKLMGKSVRIISNDQVPLEKLLPELETELKRLICPCLPFSSS